MRWSSFLPTVNLGLNGSRSLPRSDISFDQFIETVTQPRASGVLCLSARTQADKTQIEKLHQKGSLKALFPRPVGTHLDVVSLNTAGGITGGDRFRVEIAALQDTQITVSTQAAERAYRAHLGDVGKTKTFLNLESGAHINWLPQETILFNQAAYQREMQVVMDGTASALIVEPVVFGRPAMSETLTQIYFHDNWRIKRDGKLIYADDTKISGDAAQLMSQAATANGAGAMASVVYLASNAEAQVSRIRAKLPQTAGVSLIKDGLLVVRILALNSFELRKTLIPIIECLSANPLPKVWNL